MDKRVINLDGESCFICGEEFELHTSTPQPDDPEFKCECAMHGFNDDEQRKYESAHWIASEADDVICPGCGAIGYIVIDDDTASVSWDECCEHNIAMWKKHENIKSVSMTHQHLAILSTLSKWEGCLPIIQERIGYDKEEVEASFKELIERGYIRKKPVQPQMAHEAETYEMSPSFAVFWKNLMTGNGSDMWPGCTFAKV